MPFLEELDEAVYTVAGPTAIFACPAPLHAHRYRQLWRCDVAFGAERNAFLFDAGYLA